MRRACSNLLIPLVLIAFALPSFAQTAAPPAVDAPPATRPASRPARRPPTTHQLEVMAMVDKQDPAEPAVKVDAEGNPNRGFLQKHESFLARGKQGPIDVLFLGDSITEGWGGAGRQVWEQRYADRNAANFGIGGDRTQHVLWRIQNGELDNIHPKVVVLMIGTNNIGQSAADIARGTTAVVHAVSEKLPDTKILLLAIFPRDEQPDSPRRAKLTEVNQMLSKLDDGKHVFYLDIGGKFLQPDGVLPKSLFPDSLHPNKDGYVIWADAIQGKLDELTK